MRILVPVAWLIWGIVVSLLLYGMFLVYTDRGNSPEGGRGIALGVLLILVLVVAAAGGGIWWFAQRQSIAGLAILSLILAFPVTGVIANKILLGMKEKAVQISEGRIGDFPDPAARALAQAIQAGDAAALRQHLGGQPPPPAKDKAGHDLLAYSALLLRDRGGSVDCFRALLEAGASPKSSRMPNGDGLLSFLIVDTSANAQNAARLLLSHGADPNEKDPATGWTPILNAGESPETLKALVEAGANIEAEGDGLTPVVRFTMLRHFDSAIYLVEKGAKLDTKSPSGVSLDYYLEDWKNGVHGQPNEGWDRLRAAIAKRRGR